MSYAILSIISFGVGVFVAVVLMAYVENKKDEDFYKIGGSE